MKINSVWHLTFSGRSLYIDSSSGSRKKGEVTVFTRGIELDSYIQADTRIVPENIAKLMGLRKYIPISDKISVKAGSFDIKIENVSDNGLRYNIVVNDTLFFLSFIPEMIKPMNRDSILLIPADTFYFNVEDLEKIKNFIDLSKAKKIFATGDMSMDLAAMFKSGKITIVNEAVQQDIFK
ncbi:MAG TPA: hypothetical protein VLJ60_12905 [bacterium]|nr:hypothetical protein [bacterium]